MDVNGEENLAAYNIWPYLRDLNLESNSIGDKGAKYLTKS